MANRSSWCNGLALIALCLCVAARADAGALEAYVRQADSSFAWRSRGTQMFDVPGIEVTTLELVSQTWRGGRWTHTLYIARPGTVRHPATVFLDITHGASHKHLPAVKRLAETGGTLVAVLTDVPNQPLYGNRYEDDLIAYTFDQYLRGGDDSWPLLLPMTKSAVRAMDAIQAWARATHGQQVERFVVSGASKRGWTAWLTGAVDPRVCAIVPTVIDMLNLKAQTQWSQRVYGRQSEKISAYTNIGLIEWLDRPEGARLQEIVDPFSYRAALTMPKLLLLGTNDPFWTVDSLRHYWDDLPGPKIVYQAPNAGHGAGNTEGAARVRAAFLQMIAQGKTPPQMSWRRQNGATDTLHVEADRRARDARLWRAHAPTRDFRKAVWKSAPLALDAQGLRATVPLTAAAKGFTAYMAEFSFSEGGCDFQLSTQVYVSPDLPPPPKDQTP